MKINAGALLALAVAAFGSVSAQAAPITYSNFADWSAAVASYQTLAIPDPAPDQFAYFGQGTASVTYAGVTFSQNGLLSDGFFFNVGTLYPALDPVPAAVLSSQAQTYGPANIRISFTGSITGLSLNYSTFDGSAVTFSFLNGDQVVQPSAGSLYDTIDFFGVTRSAPFNTILITSPDEALNINDLSFTSPIPEPASWCLILVGFLSLGFWSSRRPSQIPSTAKLAV